MTISPDLTVTRAQVEFLMQKFDIDDPNKAIDFLIEMMAMEEVELEPTNIKRYMMKLMERELRNADSK